MQAELIQTNHSQSTSRSNALPQLLAPAGNWECATAAVENGADAIYFGLDKFNARMRAENFTEADLPELMEFLHRRGVKGYVTLNTLVFPQELREAERYLRSIIAAGVDAVIVQDIGICRLIRHLSPDFPIHASTQMTITSDVGVEFAETLGCNLVVLARECSLPEINKIQNRMQYRGATLPLEVFVHGALCVAYSGQCLTSEALGGRSANRGECAQACRMPYELVVDGESVDLGDKKYLLSPQDLAGLSVLPELVQAGVSCLKIEGRLKSPEYVANVTRVYREALDRLMMLPEDTVKDEEITETEVKADFPKKSSISPSPEELYNLEMAFSRGIYTGWFRGINNQELVHARFGKKRGVYLGKVKQIRHEEVIVTLEAPLKPGDGVVFDCGHPETKEEGGRVYGVQQRGKEAIITFGKDNLNWRRVHVGDKLWKTSDPELDKQLRQSYAGDTPQFQRPIDIEVHGEVDNKLVTVTRDELGYVVLVESEILLQEAHTKPLTTEKLQEQLGRLGNTPFKLGNLNNYLQGNVILPVSELNKIRREIVSKLAEQRAKSRRWQLNQNASLKDLLPKLGNVPIQEHKDKGKDKGKDKDKNSHPNLIVLVRNLQQLAAALEAGIETVYCEFEDTRKYREAVEMVKGKKRDRETLTQEEDSISFSPSLPLSGAYSPNPEIFLAPPRITKPGENWILQQVRSHNADGYLIRNYDQLQFFANDRCVGDFSLNVANPLTADYLYNKFGLERVTASYDLNINQLEDLITSSPPEWYEVTIHQHMPMFHMEHCVFCAFLSTGTDFTNCGRPCEKYEVKLRDRVGSEHILQADLGCRNTVFNATAQTGAEYVQKLLNSGLKNFRIEFVNETPDDVKQTIQMYQQLLCGKIKGSQLWRELKLQNQLGVTRGTVVH
ncbi:U32 family peptidase [Calothrix sp. UHCC 0171]|uniref:U32 family peptidase n=1 Tax=Calothrix sp. UHCC 0171 TaxID=3110245 RepID=UPI002B220F83|nr:U32 family peptidase [Calothrix sp. UHCC 0171]MEA5572314.1 U32 family peptidase [Calothrix sp. UHCC 0171]